MIDQIFSTLARFVNHRPKLVVGIIGVVFVIALVGMTMITMATGNDTYMDKNSPEGIANNQYTNTFSADSLILIVETSDPLSPDVLNYLNRLEGDIRQQQNIASASSIVDILKSENNGVTSSVKGGDRCTRPADARSDTEGCRSFKRPDTRADPDERRPL